MKYIQKQLNVVDLAYQIIDMNNELMRLRDENKELKVYEERYNKLLNDSIKHGNTMMGHTLSACLNMNE